MSENESKEMSIAEIKGYLKPTLNEVFEGYICVGFRADNNKPIIIGDVGHKWNNYRDCLKRSGKIIQDMLKEESAESYWQ